MPVRVTIKRWRCSYCRKALRSQRRDIDRHEQGCKKNPTRIPWPGELSRIYDCNFPWWPGAGMIWDGQKWLSVMGYRFEEEEDDFCAAEHWPNDLDRLRPSERLSRLRGDL